MICKSWFPGASQITSATKPENGDEPRPVLRGKVNPSIDLLLYALNVLNNCELQRRSLLPGPFQTPVGSLVFRVAFVLASTDSSSCGVT